MHIKTILGLTVAGVVCLSCQSNSYQIEGFALDCSEGDTICMIQEPQKGVATISLVENGKFAFAGVTDTMAFCRIFPKKTPERSVTIFLGPGQTTVELSSRPAGNRVSGTKINNEWQLLNDSVRWLGQEAVRTVMLPVTDSTTQRQRVKRVDSLHRRMSACILNTARRNSDNPLGQYIKRNYQAPEFK